MTFPVMRRPRPSYGAPPSVEHLPFTLMRDALITRDPDVVAAATEVFLEQEAERNLYEGPSTPYALPQKMQFQQWKTPPRTGGANRPEHADPYEPTAGFMRLRAQMLGLERDLIQANNPQVYPIEHAAFDRRGSDRYEPVDTRPLLLRDAPAWGRPIYPYPWPGPAEELGFEVDEVEHMQGLQRRADEIRAMQDVFRDMLLDDVRGR